MQLISRIASLLSLAHRTAREDDALVAATAMQFLDLTSLTGKESAADIRTLCRRAMDAGCAAVCVYPSFVAAARTHLADSDVKCASVAMGFPDARGTLAERLAEIEHARRDGADEIDIVVSTSLILHKNWDQLRHELEAARNRCGERTLKVILETGALPDAGTIYQSARIALDEGADFVKTSTGKVPVGATLEAAAAIILAIDDHGEERGIKISGGIRQLAEYRPYHQMVAGHWGLETLTPSRVRVGASSLLQSLHKVVRSNQHF